eukprot:gene21843-26290_t
MNLPIMETQLSGFRSHYIRNFQQTSGDVTFGAISSLQDETVSLDIAKLTFEMVFFKEANYDSIPDISVDIDDLMVNIGDLTSSSTTYELYDMDDNSLPSGGHCLDATDTDVSIIMVHSAAEVVDRSEVMGTNDIRSYDGTFFKQVLNVTCYLRVQRGTLTMSDDHTVPLIFDYTHTYTDLNSTTLMTNPIRKPIAIFEHELILREMTMLEYETPLKGAMYKIPQEKIRNVDRDVWTVNDVRGSMVKAFSNRGDAPRLVKAVSVNTPIVAAVTLANENDLPNYDISLVAGFLTANKVDAPKFVAFGDGNKTQQTNKTITDPCNLHTYHTNDALLGMATLFKNESADAYATRLSSDVRSYLENRDDKNYFVKNDFFQINDILKTEPITMNHELGTFDGAQNVLILPFLPKFQIANNRPIDTYETRVCMIVEITNYADKSKTSASSRKLMQVTVSTEAGGVLDLQIAILGQDYPVTMCETNCSYDNGTDSNIILQMTKSTATGSHHIGNHDDNDETFTDTNWKLSISLMVLGCSAVLLLLALVGVYWYRASMQFEAD